MSDVPKRAKNKAEYNREWRRANPERAKRHRAAAAESNREWKKRNPDKWYEYRLRRTYGLNMEQYYTLLARHDGGCFICKVRPKPGMRRLHVDHCHQTGRVRGLLCYRCNSVLGTVEKPGWMERVSEYLDGL